MLVSRRSAIERCVASLTGLAAFNWIRPFHGPAPTRAGRLLFLGGTGFLGPHMVKLALERGYQVSLFTRGRSGRDLFPGAERLTGDRAGDLGALKGRSWDAVIDNSGYVPAHVAASANLLKGSAGHYVYTSTIDAYRDFHAAGITEDYPLATLPAGAPHNPGQYYGPLKALCEREVTKAFPDAAIVRPGWVVGPGDNNHLFTYWVMRAHRGGEFLAPGAPNDPVQTVDVRDLAAFVLTLVERRIAGAFNAVAPATTFGEMLATVRQVAGTASEPVWVDAEFLKSQGVKPYFDLPLWWPPRNDYDVPNMPSGLGGGIGAFRISGAKAAAGGLASRPLRDSARDLLAWYLAEHRTWPDTGRPGLSPDREGALLAAWRSGRRE